jgi:hypothetical protein
MAKENKASIHNAYQQGVADEYRRLTQWHSPDVELPEYDKIILIKLDRLTYYLTQARMLYVQVILIRRSPQ